MRRTSRCTSQAHAPCRRCRRRLCRGIVPCHGGSHGSRTSSVCMPSTLRMPSCSFSLRHGNVRGISRPLYLSQRQVNTDLRALATLCRAGARPMQAVTEVMLGLEFHLPTLYPASSGPTDGPARRRWLSLHPRGSTTVHLTYRISCSTALAGCVQTAGGPRASFQQPCLGVHTTALITSSGASLQNPQARCITIP